MTLMNWMGGRPMPPERPNQAFWLQDCPMRGPGLTHAHERDCTVHAPDQCCICFRDPASMTVATFAPMPPVDIERRLNGDGPVQVTKEPKMRTGRLIGPADGPGRGDLTDFQKRWLSLWKDTAS